MACSKRLCRFERISPTSPGRITTFVKSARVRTPLYSPNSYSASQRFGHDLFKEGSNGVVYRSVRHTGGECLACFRPKKVLNVRVGKHYEYRWHGTKTPEIRELKRAGN